MRVSTCFLVLLFVITSCKPKPEPVEILPGRSLESFSWMLGKWRNEDTRELEFWSRRTDDYFGGMVVEVNDQGKAIIKETLALEGNPDGSVIYFARVEGQNNGRRIPFLWSNENSNIPRFENTNHNFPQIITYEKVGNDSIRVELSASGREGITFYYIREE